ncbi:hypothetical protein TanjilG_32985 [Lupinus angustifolius]|uniref:Mediator of RNA polymerase II transcription subunit 7 n=1 Tax=Lupinus angustifolius TaxID=3871 RepID=A0A4P1RNQ6_LUPAN|nr:hypothetical protein TanjilG_32985 [Lupinus angustifolius]
MSTSAFPPPPPYYRLYKNYSQDPNSAPEPPPPIEGTYVCFGATYTCIYVLFTIIAESWGYCGPCSRSCGRCDYNCDSNVVEIVITSDNLPSLEEQGVRQLYPKGANVDFKKELKSLNRDLQLHTLELADILIERPSQYARRIEEISTVFKNLHHLLNALRPHQARSTLVRILELQILNRKRAVEDIKR